MKKFFSILFYLSLLFLVYYLYTADFLKPPHIINYPHLFFSITLLLIGCLLQVLNWKDSLHVYRIYTSYFDALISVGLSIFMKYIPGKVMIVLGRAAYISNEYEVPLKNTSSASLLAQIIMLWTGLLLGSMILFSGKIDPIWSILSLITFVILTLILFLPNLLHNTLIIIARRSGKNISFPELHLSKILKISPFFFLTWLFWAIGYYFLASSLYAGSIPVITSMTFPLAASLAIAALIAPGGLGVREGILVAGLVIFSIPFADATAIAIASRLWFLLGEAFLFFLAILLRKVNN